MVWVVFANGFEVIEAVTNVDVLRRAKIEVSMVGLSDMQVIGAHGIGLQMDSKLSDESLDGPLEAIVLPGGMPGTKHLTESHLLIKCLQEAKAKGVFLAAICAAPVVLNKAGLLAGVPFTCYPGFESEVLDGKYLNQPLVVTEHILTGRSAGAAMAFSLALVEKIKGPECARALSEQLIV